MKVKITIKISPCQKLIMYTQNIFSHVLFIFLFLLLLLLLLRNPVEEAKLNNCSTHILQFLQEDRVS